MQLRKQSSSFGYWSPFFKSSHFRSFGIYLKMKLSSQSKIENLESDHNRRFNEKKCNPSSLILHLKYGIPIILYTEFAKSPPIPSLQSLDIPYFEYVYWEPLEVQHSLFWTPNTVLFKVAVLLKQPFVKFPLISRLPRLSAMARSLSSSFQHPIEI